MIRKGARRAIAGQALDCDQESIVASLDQIEDVGLLASVAFRERDD
jgi:hypothetical protein